MEKYAENISYNHGISINERKLIYLTGVQKIESFDDEEFLLETNMGYLGIKGSGLEIVRLDTKDGTLSIGPNKNFAITSVEKESQSKYVENNETFIVKTESGSLDEVENHLYIEMGKNIKK